MYLTKSCTSRCDTARAHCVAPPEALKAALTAIALGASLGDFRTLDNRSWGFWLGVSSRSALGLGFIGVSALDSR